MGESNRLANARRDAIGDVEVGDAVQVAVSLDARNPVRRMTRRGLAVVGVALEVGAAGEPQRRVRRQAVVNAHLKPDLALDNRCAVVVICRRHDELGVPGSRREETQTAVRLASGDAAHERLGPPRVHVVAHIEDRALFLDEEVHVFPVVLASFAEHGRTLGKRLERAAVEVEVARLVFLIDKQLPCSDCATFVQIYLGGHIAPSLGETQGMDGKLAAVGDGQPPRSDETI